MKIAQVATALFPDGYLDFQTLRNVRQNRGSSAVSFPAIGRLPYLCTDLFALVAMLLQRSGAYHHVAPDSHAPHAPRTLSVDEAERTLWMRLGQTWRGDGANAAVRSCPGTWCSWAVAEPLAKRASTRRRSE